MINIYLNNYLIISNKLVKKLQLYKFNLYDRNNVQINITKDLIKFLISNHNFKIDGDIISGKNKDFEHLARHVDKCQYLVSVDYSKLKNLQMMEY
jgi:hypothetical protein